MPLSIRTAAAADPKRKDSTMTLPNPGSAPRYLENLRIGGGYGSTPDGGADLDAAGNLAADGDLTVDGDAAVGGEWSVGGMDTTWKAFMSSRIGWPTITQGCGAPVQIEIGALPRLNLWVMDFDKDTQEYGQWHVFLPDDYDGRTLLVRVYWIATAGTAGVVRFRIHCLCFDDGDAITDTSSDGAVEDTFIGTNTLHSFEKTFTPVNPSARALAILGLRREASHANDTFDADARVIGIEISYA